MKSIQRLGWFCDLSEMISFAFSCNFLSSVILSGLCLFLVPFVNTIKFEDFSAITENASQECKKTFWKPRICPRELDESLYEAEDAKYVASNSIYRLRRLAGVKVGHVREMNITDNKTLLVTTRSLRPLLFEIPEFLTFHESNKLIQLTQKLHLENSETVNGRGEGFERKEFEKKMKGLNLTLEKISLCTRLEAFDSDDNEKVTLQEFIAYLDRAKQLHPTRMDASPIFNFLDLDFDGSILLEECFTMTNDVYMDFRYSIEKLKRNPRYFIRFSESVTFPTQEPLVKTIQDRAARLTGLSKTLIEKSEPIQVVRYSEFGHYNVHYDTTYGSASRRKCCQGVDYEDCHLCRFATIILYLNDVAKGGETAFPVADDWEKFVSGGYSITMNERCEEASLLVKPKKGKAVLWYNHLLKHDGADHMGRVDRLSLHGGCDVEEGVKWIANVWINAPVEPGGEI